LQNQLKKSSTNCDKSTNYSASIH